MFANRAMHRCGGWAMLGAALLLAGTPALGAPRPAAKPVKSAKAKLAVESDTSAERLRPGGLGSFSPSLIEAGKFSFTAPGRTGANARVQSVERAFRFTPSGQSDNRKALSLGVSARTLAPAADTSRAAAPVESAALPQAYNVDLAVGWRGFAVSGGYTRVDPGVGVPAFASSFASRREAVDLGLSYRGKGWKTSLQVGAEQSAPLFLSPAERRYSVEFGGAYAVAPGLSVGGGVRYQMTPLGAGVLDADREDGTVYLGTNVAF